MRVRVYDVDGQGNEWLRGESDLRDCFPDSDEFHKAFVYLRDWNRYWAGGGSGQLVLLMRVQENR